MKYSYDTRVGYSEIAENGYMTPGAVVDRFQDCSNFQSDALGVGADYLAQCKKAWILNSWHIVFDKPIEMGERIRVYTWASRFDKIFGYRNFMIEDENGGRCAGAASKWMLIDTKNMRLLKITDDDAKMYGVDESLDIEYVERKLNVLNELQEIDTIKVRGYQIDTNGHMNNSWYIKIAMDYIDKNEFVKEIYVEYRKSAVCGDKVKIKKCIENDNTIIVMCDENDSVYSVIRIIQAK